MAGLQVFAGVCASLLDLAFLVQDVLAHFGVVFLDFHFSGLILFVFGSGVEMTGARAGIQANFFANCFCHDSAPQTFSPRARISVKTVSMPFLSMIRIPFVDTRNLIQRSSLSTQKRW
jgi:hypothetical protein